MVGEAYVYVQAKAKDMRDLSSGRFSNSPITRGDVMAYMIVGGIAAIVLALLVWLNLRARRIWRKLTQDERRALNEQIRDDLHYW